MSGHLPQHPRFWWMKEEKGHDSIPVRRTRQTDLLRQRGLFGISMLVVAVIVERNPEAATPSLAIPMMGKPFVSFSSESFLVASWAPWPFSPYLTSQVHRQCIGSTKWEMPLARRLCICQAEGFPGSGSISDTSTRLLNDKICTITIIIVFRRAAWVSLWTQFVFCRNSFCLRWSSSVFLVFLISHSRHDITFHQYFHTIFVKRHSIRLLKSFSGRSLWYGTGVSECVEEWESKQVRNYWVFLWWTHTSWNRGWLFWGWRRAAFVGGW